MSESVSLVPYVQSPAKCDIRIFSKQIPFGRSGLVVHRPLPDLQVWRDPGLQFRLHLRVWSLPHQHEADFDQRLFYGWKNRIFACSSDSVTGKLYRNTLHSNIIMNRYTFTVGNGSPFRSRFLVMFHHAR